MAAILTDIQPGDEIIMPSYTFVSTANAFVLRGGVPVFVDIRSDTLNLDETKIEAAIGPRTKAIVPVQYAGVACEMNPIMKIAEKYNLSVIEDAALGIMSSYRGRKVGSIGHMAALSFHETKNIVSGEGGALLISDSKFIERSEIIWEKGTNRSQFFRGEVDKYTWVDIGSSFLPSELIAAFLWGQLERSQEILKRRLKIWQKYHDAFFELESKGMVRRPMIPEHSEHNAHMYYLLLPNMDIRSKFIKGLKQRGIMAVFHYVPLHSSPAGRKFCRVNGEMKNSNEMSERLVRLPLWLGMEDHMTELVDTIKKTLYEVFPDKF
jgi:dTDP-4-amino-4,6-dideoxygalactose transaminase